MSAQPNPFQALDDEALFALLGDHLRHSPIDNARATRDLTLGQWREKLAKARQAILDGLTPHQLASLLAAKAPDVVVMTKTQYEADLDQATASGRPERVYTLNTRREVELADGTRETADSTLYTDSDLAALERMLASGAFADSLDHPEEFFVILSSGLDARNLDDIERWPSFVAYYDRDGSGPLDEPPVTAPSAGLRR